MAGKPKVKNDFGKGAEVICKQADSPFEFLTGIITTGRINKDCQYEVEFAGNGDKKERAWIHANDLDLAEDSDLIAKGAFTVELPVSPELAEKLTEKADDDDTDQEDEAAQDDSEQKPYIIKEAIIKDDYCNYAFEILSGIGAGDTHSVKGSGIIMDDMKEAFNRFNVHLAVIDDVFKHSGIEIEDIDKYHGHDLAFLFTVTGFKISGGEDNESIILKGSKYVSSAGGRIELASPKIPLDNLSSYKWYNELRAAADSARMEVALYKEGKVVPAEEDEKPNPKQLTITDNMLDIVRTAVNGQAGDEETHEEEFENARM